MWSAHGLLFNFKNQWLQIFAEGFFAYQFLNLLR